LLHFFSCTGSNALGLTVPPDVIRKYLMMSRIDTITDGLSDKMI
jgi:hypothetical protein